MRKFTVGIVLVIVFVLVGCREQDSQSENKLQAAKSATTLAPKKEKRDRSEDYLQVYLQRFLPALPKEFVSDEAPITEAKIELGRMLYFEKRLSKNHDISCNSCHLLDQFGVDGEKTSPGHREQRGERNSPTVYNAAGHFVQFWDGRSAHVEHQATQPIINPVEMAMPDEKRVVATLKSMPGYVKAFKKAFPEDKVPISLSNVGRAIGAFERRLVTPSRWDQFLEGDKSALTEEERHGFLTFVHAECPSCHLGTLVGGSSYHRAGSVNPWPNQTDLGRFEITKEEAFKMIFKVPSLRNVEKTAPYFHDGSAATLPEAVKMMAFHQLGREIPDKDIQSIITWLKTLTGEVPTEYIKEPKLPQSTSRTPPADPT